MKPFNEKPDPLHGREQMTTEFTMLAALRSMGHLIATKQKSA